ncbi:MAG: ornithine cyclodeaminase family protein [Clostridiales bacterium]|nr:ornithine cyclodeaminase family protein [Clostridiales bacterium]
MLLLNKNDMEKIFSMREAIEACKLAFQTYSTGGSVVPLRTNIEVSKYKGATLFMPGYVETMDFAGIKIVSVFPENAALGKPTVPATMVLVDSTTGEVCCILDGTYLTKLRTGAAAGAATDIMACPNAEIGALIGIGGQALSQLDAMLTTRELKEVRIYNRNLNKLETFINEAKAVLKYSNTVLIPVTSSDEAIFNADIITTVTTSIKPVLNGNKVKKGAHVNAVGSFMPHMQELDDNVIKRADKIFVDSLDAVLAESGDFIIPLKNGSINKEKINGELGQVIAGTIKGREFKEEITLFKTVGIAVQDVVTAFKIYQKANINNIGYKYNFN